MESKKEQILKLRSEGYSYSQIQQAVNCSKSTISYHLGEGQKQKTRDRTKKLRAENPMLKKISEFRNCKRIRSEYIENPDRRIRINPVRDKIHKFLRIITPEGKALKVTPGLDFNEIDLVGKYNSTCYLTGRQVDLTDPTTYSLDHITSRSDGGDNSFENCGLTCTPANQAKGKLSLEDFKQLCLEVVNHFNLK